MLTNSKTGEKRHFDHNKVTIREGAGGLFMGLSAFSIGLAQTPAQKVAAISLFIATTSAVGAEEIGPEDINLNFNDQTKYLNETLVGSDSNFNDGDLN